MFERRWFGAVAACVLVFSVISGLPAAQSQEIDDLLSEIDQLSQEASAQNEEVKALEVDIEGREVVVEGIRGKVAHFRSLANEAVKAADAYRGEINTIAQAKYRGTVVDPLTIAVSAEDPQNVIDRLSFLSTLAKSTGDVVEGLNLETSRAADSLDEAHQMKAQADFQLGVLRGRLEDLGREQAALEQRKEDIRALVDGFSPEVRQQWIEKNGPMNIDLAEFLGASGEAAGAIDSALSKIGSPYGWGAIGPSAFDCSGLIYWAFQQQGKTLPRTSQAQMAGGTPVSRDQLQPGDVIGYYPGATHVGLYIGDGKIVHASDYGIPVQVVSVDSAPFYGARRY